MALKYFSAPQHDQSSSNYFSGSSLESYRSITHRGLCLLVTIDHINSHMTLTCDPVSLLTVYKRNTKATNTIFATYREVKEKHEI